MDFSFDAATGNLASRTGMFFDGSAALTETFGYDNLDRLNTIHVGVSPPGALNMSVGYHINGNIQNKTGIGAYSYGENAGAHVLTGV